MGQKKLYEEVKFGLECSPGRMNGICRHSGQEANSRVPLGQERLGSEWDRCSGLQNSLRNHAVYFPCSSQGLLVLSFPPLGPLFLHLASRMTEGPDGNYRMRGSLVGDNQSHETTNPQIILLRKHIPKRNTGHGILLVEVARPWPYYVSSGVI